MSRLVIALLLGQLALSAGCYQSYPWLAEREDGGHWTPTPDAAGDRDAGAWDGSLRDSGSHDGSLRDASLRDASSIDASPIDASLPDASLPDASLPDASLPDASLPDGGPIDRCEAGWLAQLRAPTTLFADQPLALSGFSESGGGCACQPRVMDASPGAPLPSLRYALCECCLPCGCIDPGYEVGYRGSAPLPIGDHTISLGFAEATVAVVPQSSCQRARPGSRMEALSLEIMAPSRTLRTNGTEIYWARVSLEDEVCCRAQILPAFRVAPQADGSLSLELYRCTRDPCACTRGFPQPFTTWVPLPPLPSGTHRIVLETLSATVVVP